MHEELRESRGIRYLVFNHFVQSNVMHGFTLREGGVSQAPYDTLNLGLHVGDQAHAVQENRRRLAQALGYSPDRVTVGQQVHKTEIVQVTSELIGRGHMCGEDALPQTDGLISTEPNIILMAHAADCTILFFHDAKTGCIGIAHAGWRGAVAGMGPKMVTAMEAVGCRRENIRIALSPCIGPCCYQVGDNVAEEIQSDLRHHVLSNRDGQIHFDMPGLHALQLYQAGVLHSNLVQSQYCTNCNPDLFFSYRASGGHTGRMVGMISNAG